MSQDVFDQNQSTIYTEIKTILAAKGKTRKRFRVVAVYEKSTGDLLAEILRTSLGPVVVHRVAALDPNFRGKSEHIVDLRQDRNGYSVVPLTGHPKQYYIVKSRSTSYPITGSNIRDRRFPGDLLVFR